VALWAKTSDHPVVESLKGSLRRDVYEKSFCLNFAGSVKYFLVRRGLGANSYQKHAAVAGFAKSQQEAAEGDEKIHEGATQSRAEDAEDGTQKYKASAAQILI
jgi:hypothetical protein